MDAITPLIGPALGFAGTCLVVGFGYGAVSILQDMRVLLQPDEMVWVTSQRPAAQDTPTLLADETVVTLTRTRCYGFCPIYELKLYGSGRVEFRGKAYVCEMSPRSALVDRDRVRRLIDGLAAVRFTEMRSYTNDPVDDSPTATISLKTGAAAHTVRHAHGDHAAPLLLSMIEERIDEVAGTAAWLGVWEGDQYLCVRPDGSRVPVEKFSPPY